MEVINPSLPLSATRVGYSSRLQVEATDVDDIRIVFDD